MYKTHIFPFFMDLGMRGRLFSRYRRTVLRGLQGDVLEIGAGTGLNFPHYPSQVQEIHTIEPNPGMGSRAEKRAEKAGIRLHQHVLSAETLPFTDARFDAVVSTWTLCSIPDVQRALAEVHRVLRPGGRFTYVEHGLAPDENVRRWQHRLNPLQNVIADGCNLNRDIHSLIEQAGLVHVQEDAHYVEHAPKTVGYFYIGIAEKQG
ncbi:MAG: Methylase involved in ubiquinone/menaquinone biosynthesis [Bacteroidetes bacterium HLUCCA01]|nr:MAG: Methylase involved in ubiquinone/menaquinone biosynthesis [Bacteroidetes bacterium HLUCCA01]